jgi:DivIVA domain-containing protein
MEWFIAAVVIAALGVAAVAAAGGMGEMSRDPVRDVYRQDLPMDRPLVAADINQLRFGVTLRGYAMGQVDDVLDRLGREIAERDLQIAELRGALLRRVGPEPATLDEPPTVTAREIAPHQVGPA